MQKIREAVRPKYKEFVAKHLDKLCNSMANGENISIISFEAIRYKIIDFILLAFMVGYLPNDVLYFIGFPSFKNCYVKL